MKRRIITAMLALTLAMGLVACSSESNSQTANNDSTNTNNTTQNNENNTTDEAVYMPAIAVEDLKIGVLYVGPIGDEGYSYAHHQGILEMQETLGLDASQILIEENVAENSECETSVRNLIDQGCNVIYATSFGHMDYTAKVAADHPEIYFAHATGYTQLDNMTNYMGRIFEARYLSGVAAGLNTETNKIGYVAAMSIPEVDRGINAFALGVKSVNEEATIEVKWVGSWYDPTLEKSIAVDLINGGCDVIAQHCDTTGPQIASEEKDGVLTIGYNAATMSVSPNSYITAPLFHWGTFYTANVQAIIEGTWQSESYYEGLSAGVVSLDDINESVVAEGTVEAVELAEQAILDGSLYVFTGPIIDNKGNEVCAEGEELTYAQILGDEMNWFLDNVIGE